MALEDYEADMTRCTRCSDCKFAPASQLDEDFPEICPSISRFGFHSYSASGRLIAGLSFLSKRIDHSPALLDILYTCQMCGACDVACKKDRELEPLETMLEFRKRCVDDGKTLPALDKVIRGLEHTDNMMLRPAAGRGDWAKGLPVKDLSAGKADVAYHAGCRLSFDSAQWKIARSAIEVLSHAGVEVAIAGDAELCCGGRAYEMGYQDHLEKYAERHRQQLEAAGVKTLLTSCAHCYHAFEVLYTKIGKKLDLEVVHVAEYVGRLLSERRIELTREVPLEVTYHDPCHLGRLAEPWIPWDGEEKKVMQQLVVHDPPKQFRRGRDGVYEPPREVLRSIPGVRLGEMKRTRGYAWCCGSGGGVREAYPDFAAWTAAERMKEAESTGAQALASACPWCIRGLEESARERGSAIEVYDVVELVRRAL